MRVVLLEAGGDPRARRRRAPARRLRRAGLPCLRLRERGDGWNFLVRHYADEAPPGDATGSTTAGQGVLYPRAGSARRLHRAQRDDLHAAARLRTGTDIAQLTGDRSWRAARMRRYCAAPGGLPAPAGLACAAPARPRPDRAWLGRLAAHREVDPAARCFGDDGAGARDARHAPSGFTSSLPTPLLSALRWLVQRPGRPQRRGACGPAASRASATRRCRTARPSPRRRARAAARRGRSGIRTGCTSSSTRWPRASCSTPTARAVGVEYLKGERLYRAHASAERGAGRARARCARGAR